MIRKLIPEQLRRQCDPKLLHCKTSEEIKPLEEIIGQRRAVKAIRFGLDIEQRGFNIYAAGYPGTGRTTAVNDFLKEIAKKKPIPQDWCYVNNFKNQYEPKSIKLPPGEGNKFQTEIANLIENVQKSLPKVFESEEFAAKKEEAISKIENERKNLLSELNEKAKKEGFVLQSTQIGILIIPVFKGKPLGEDEFMALNPEIREEIKKRREKVNAELRTAMRQLRSLEGKVNEEIQNLNQEVALYSIGHLFETLREKYGNLPDIVTYLDDMQKDILDNLDQFLKPESTSQEMSRSLFPVPWMKKLPLRKYEVNVIVDNANLKGAPVIIESNPTYQNVFGRIEKEAQFGVLTTDFTMIRGGSIHKANGGYLVLPVGEMLQNMFTWEGLKNSLKNKKISIEEVGERLGFITTKGLRPKPIELKAKIILIGNPEWYQMLFLYDKDFKELFKVKAEFDVTMSRTEENMRRYAAFICTFCTKDNLKHLDSSAIAQVIEYGSRLAQHQDKMSTRFADVADIIREASFYATQKGDDYIFANHIEKAIEEKLYRSNLIQERLKEMIGQGILLIDTEGKSVGQVNGLSVMSLGDFTFGMSSRVTASVGLGKEGVIDIEREAKMGGPIHTKGVMILSGYLSQKYAQNKPLSLTARIVFEQSYGGVEGDSASSTELYAILSALSDLPIKQNLAVTGSVNQKGEVQAIGGVNEKIEGFFEICKTKGFNGQQGVVIPESNIQNLMLKEEVVEAVRSGKFHVYPVKTIDQGIEVLTGVKAGKRLPNGEFEENTINRKVDERLKKMAEKIKEFSEIIVETRKSISS